MIKILVSIFLAIVFSLGTSFGKEMKKIEFSREHLATLADIDELKAFTEKDLPNWYVDHFMHLSGLKRVELTNSEIDDNTHVDFTAVYEDGNSDGDHITNFMTAAQIKQVWPYIDYLEDDVEHFEISSKFVQWEHLFPLANSGDGTIYIAIGGDHNRAVYEADNGDYGIGRVAADIDDFVASLGIIIK